MRRSRKRKSESGFALLLVFLMAAVIGISLYMEIPRVAVESQRQKEQLLVERGNQYKRAIKVFLKTNNRWPGRIEELESFNNRRFLRRRFIDPLTGKDEWRMIHISNGVLTDSVTTKQKKDGEKKSADSFQWNLGGGADWNNQGAGAGGAATAKNRIRSNEGAMQPMGEGSMPPGGSDPNAPLPTQGAPGMAGSTGPQGTPGMNGMPVTPGIPGQTGATGPTGSPGMPPYPPGTPYPPPVMPGQPGMPGYPNPNPNPNPTGAPGFPGQGGPGLPGQGGPGFPGQLPVGIPGQPVNSQTGGVAPSPYPTTPGAQGASPPFPQPGMDPQNQNAAVNMINRILTGPRPGAAGATPTGPPGAIGNGIAGVASHAEGEGIMVINDQTNYEDWEFIYDPTKDRPPPNPLAAAGGTPASQLGNTQGMNPIGTPIGNGPAGTGFGNNPAGGFGGGFGTGMGPGAGRGGPGVPIGRQ